MSNYKDSLREKRVTEEIIYKMDQLTVDVNNAITIDNDIKVGIRRSSPRGGRDTLENIAKKRKDFLKLVFENNPGNNEIKMGSLDIGLERSLEDVLVGKEIKKDVIVLKENIDNAIDVSSKTDANTALYAELENKNDFVKFNIGGPTALTVTRTKVFTEFTCLAINSNVIGLNSKFILNAVGDGSDVYDENVKYGLYETTYTLNVPISHPIALLNKDNSNNITYSGDENKKTTQSVNGVDYDFYHGDVTVLVEGDFGSVSLWCAAHGSMGGENLLNYSEVCQQAGAGKHDNDEWTVNYNNVDYVKKKGEKISLNDHTVYIGSVYIDGETAGIPSSGDVFDLKFARIPFDADDNRNITSFSNNDKIREDRHSALATVWTENPGSTEFLTNSSDLGLDRTVGNPIKNKVKVLLAKNNSNNDSMVDLDSSDINKNQGIYGDLSANGDYIVFTASDDTLFRIQVVSPYPNKRYMFKNADGSDIADQNIEWRDGQWATYKNVTFYFGGVYTSGTNDGISAADPYVFPIKGNPYKLPDKKANYCLYADKNTFITGMVRQLSSVEQDKMREWVIKKTGSDTNNGAKLVTDGYFYSAIHVNTNVGELYLDMENKVCNTTNKGVFNVDFKNTKDNSELFDGENKNTATISWKENGNFLAIDVDFFENPQIRNGIKMNSIITKNKSIGLLVEDYEPELLRVKNPKNKLSKYYTILKKLESGEHVNGEKLNLQKKNELWTRHSS